MNPTDVGVGCPDLELGVRVADVYHLAPDAEAKLESILVDLKGEDPCLRTTRRRLAFSRFLQRHLVPALLSLPKVGDAAAPATSSAAPATAATKPKALLLPDATPPVKKNYKPGGSPSMAAVAATFSPSAFLASSGEFPVNQGRSNSSDGIRMFSIFVRFVE